MSTEDYTVSDNISKPEKLILPVQLLAPGDSLKIIGANHTGVGLESGVVKAEFRMKEGETLILYHKKELVDMVKIPELKNGNRYQRDLTTMKFYEI